MVWFATYFYIWYIFEFYIVMVYICILNLVYNYVLVFKFLIKFHFGQLLILVRFGVQIEHIMLIYETCCDLI